MEAVKSNIEELLRDGKLGKVVKPGRPYSYLVYSDGKATGFAECQICGKVLTRGGNVNRHVKRHGGQEEGDFDLEDSRVEENEPVTASHRDQWNFAVASYVLRSGTAFSRVKNDEFRQLIADVATAALHHEEVENSLPGRKGVRNRVDEMAKALMHAAFDEVKQPIETGMAAVVVDLGTVHEEYLSVFISYVNPESFTLRVVPLGLVHNSGGKDHQQIHDLIMRCVDKFGLDENILCKATFVSDGAAAMTKCGEAFFSNSLVCANHRLHALSKHIVEPYKSTESQFTKEELAHLRFLKEAVDRCQNIASMIRKDKKVRVLLPKLPSAPVDTRWLSVLQTVTDVLSLQHDIFTAKDDLPFNLMNCCHAVTAKVEYLHALIASLEPMKEKMLVFQEETQVTIHRVVPFLRLIKEHYEEQENDANNSAIERVIAKSSRIAADMIMGKTLTDVHLVAMLLSPQYKGFRRFSAQEKEQAMSKVREMLADVPKAQQITVSPAKKKRLLLDDEDEPATDELSTYCAIPTSSKVSVEEFWRNNRQTFPRLFIFAKKVFGILPSEAACERHFSLVGRLITKYRKSLSPDVVERIVLGAQLSRMYQFK